MYIGEYMHTNVVTVSSDTRVRDAEQIMNKNKIRRLPVVDKEKLVGLLTRGKIRQATGSHASSLTMWELNYLLQKLKAKEIMETHLYTVNPDTPVEKVIRQSQELEISTILVVDKQKHDKLLGIATTTDLYKAATSLFGFSQPGVRLRIHSTNGVKALEVVRILARYDADIRAIYYAARSGSDAEDCVVHLGNGYSDEIKADLTQKGFEVAVSFSPAAEAGSTVLSASPN